MEEDSALSPGEHPQRVTDITEKNKSANASQLKSKSTNPLPPICRFYSRGRYCQYGNRCRFLHEHPEPRPEQQTGGPAETASSPAQSTAKGLVEGVAVKAAEKPLSHGRPEFAVAKAPAQRQPRPKKPCRYYLSGYCVMEERCRFWHPEKQPPLRDPVDMERTRVVHRPAGPGLHLPGPPPTMSKEEVKLTELTQEVARELRGTEITQLIKRFPKDKLIVQEREDGKLTYYRITVQPTDPDWPFDLKEIDIQVSFPDEYPLEVFTVQIPEDQDLPASMGSHMCSCSEEWLKAKHATNKLMGKLELLFRPYLRWLDRNMEKLFTEGARQLKRDLDTERAGIQFVPYQQLQIAVCGTLPPGCPPAQTIKLPPGFPAADTVRGLSQNVQRAKISESDGADASGSGSEMGYSEEEEEEELSSTKPVSVGKHHLQSAGDASGQQGKDSTHNVPQKGTEVRLVGFELGEGTATLAPQQITVSLKCSRCKLTADLTMSKSHPYVVNCEKCNADIRVTFQASLLHQNTDVLGYLNLQACSPVDLVLQDSEFVVGCLNCTTEGVLQSLSYGQRKEIHCLHCHSKLSILIEAAHFHLIHVQPQEETGIKNSAHIRQKKLRDPTVQAGKPLPDYGTCSHFRKSCRWLRFSCCGRAYPCDFCHNDDQDHEMELATRMICGYCAKEQPYNNEKPCIACGNMTLKGTHSSHWEGGQGCRNKIKMSRKDKQKYSSAAKTVSRRSQIQPNK
ncbi:uncharacterized protein si:dkey-24l11.2 isoform X2 [Callorhinchus milii]|nr:uncharacterized protein si:dkey-24l11.2 isoform X2 [Callorhinchus milii]XP_007906267.1 uncharacterized protein si:dkey-24l11.2 isoform X2 [Callorhinchus milii]XP_007906268.1 uncharacterized protein si:dkey-24l11.2 isoform X2 [Callorhinchus milii]XP_042198921.1 uncharacterized protein si:dkey-24l11.2 isoform X2 [Callorhinchus milii]|eukprot:gi/632979072/ref/XP_007906266.1/ PREDICTED: uncharacterized protein LOC103188187 isoform X2 [Callorhinchus milii]